MKCVCRYELKNAAGFMESIFAERTFLVREVRSNRVQQQLTGRRSSLVL